MDKSAACPMPPKRIAAHNIKAYPDQDSFFIFTLRYLEKTRREGGKFRDFVAALRASPANHLAQSERRVPAWPLGVRRPVGALGRRDLSLRPGAFSARNARGSDLLRPTTATSRLRESGDRSPHSKTKAWTSAIRACSW